MNSKVISCVVFFPLFSTAIFAQGLSRPANISTDIIACLESHNVPYFTSLSSQWAALSTPYNLRLVYQPAIITLPTTADQVSDSVTCAAQANLKVQPKGGGHSYASFSSGGQNGSLIVDMENFNTIDVDQSSGVRLGNLALALYSQGQRALPHGSCPGVGVGGHATHGGYGYDSRLWGLTLDTIVALDVVLANGSQIHTTATSYPDIFYAMRGAADSFGIVTSFSFQTLAAPATVTFFQAFLTDSLQDIDSVTSGFLALQDFVLTSPLLSKNTTFGMYTDSDGSFSLTGLCLFCDTAEFNTTVFPALLAGFKYTGAEVTDTSWLDALTNLANGDPLQQPLTGYNEHATFYAKSLVAKNAAPLTEDAIRAFWTYIKEHQGQGPFYSIINLYGGPDSQINVPASSSSAYSDRDALWVFQNWGYTASNLPPWDPAITTLIDGLNAAIPDVQPAGNFSAYSNYVDSDYNAAQAAAEYYGPETYAALLGIKTAVDPDRPNPPPKADYSTHRTPALHTSHHREIQHAHQRPHLPARPHQLPELPLRYPQRLRRVGASCEGEKQTEEKRVDGRAYGLVQQGLEQGVAFGEAGGG
ncbi:hypothetical protein B7494_g2713 [Chlorociboria aeruginascens]|nr:hypothetical protein B7494_g2713 [Chlorociboria aeruginascens]